MRYPAPELRELSDTDLAALRLHPAHFNEVKHPSGLSEMMQFQLDYLPRATAPDAPLPILLLTLFIQEGQYALNLGLVQAPAEYNAQHDSPVQSPFLARLIYAAVLSQAQIVISALPADPELLRPVQESEIAPISVASLEPLPEENVVEENVNPNELLTPRAVLTNE